MAYFITLIWVMGATVLAKILGPMLIRGTSGWLQNILSHRLKVDMTGDEIVFHLFEGRLLSDLNKRILFTLVRDFARFLGGSALISVPVETSAIRRILVPEQYWSGCPPNCQ